MSRRLEAVPDDLDDVDLSGTTAETRGPDGQMHAQPLATVLPVALVAGEPVRVARAYRGGQQHSGLHWTATTGGHVPFESALERQRLHLADHAPDVVGVLGQPMRLVADLGRGQVRRHVPDFALLHADGRLTVVDVKPEHRLDSPKVAGVLRLCRAVVERRGWDYEVWTGADPVVLANVRHLAAYRRSFLFDARDLDGAEALVRIAGDAAGREPRIGEVLATAADMVRPTLLLPLLGRLLWTHRLTADLRMPLGYGTVVALPTGAAA